MWSGVVRHVYVRVYVFAFVWSGAWTGVELSRADRCSAMECVVRCGVFV